MLLEESNYPSVINKPAATGPAASDKFMTEATSMGATTSNRLRSLRNLTNHRNTTQTIFLPQAYQVRLHIFEFRWKKAIGNSQKVIQFFNPMICMLKYSHAQNLNRERYFLYKMVVLLESSICIFVSTFSV